MRHPVLRPPRGYETLAILILAALVYTHIFGAATLLPTQHAWMLQGDPAQHYLGWQFFRQEPWQWPPGRILAYGYPLGTSIAFTDAIPLLALLLKPFSALLPDEFQYFGLWMLACYLLNGYFGLRLLARFTPHPALRLAGACFFILSPPLLLRGYGHEALMAHWLLLAGIETCLIGWSWRRWLAWSAIAALCHPYLLLMLLGLMAASAISALRIDKTLTFAPLVRQGAGIGLAVATLMGLAGYFSGTGPLAAEGYGYFSMNALSLIDPLLEWSRFIRQRPIHPDYTALGNFGQYEGFLYLGAGLLLLAAMALALHLQQPVRPERRWYPLIAVALLFWLLALSSVITFGDQRILTIPLPDPLHRLLSIFRASGRFGWPAFYLINLAVLILIVRRLPSRSALAVLLAALALQLADQQDKWREFRQIIQQRMAWQTPLQSPQWDTLARRAQTLLIVPPLPDMSTAYIPFAHLAARHRLATNAANIAHSGTQGLASEGAALIASLKDGQYDPHTLYIFPTPESVAQLPRDWQDQLITLDTYPVLPPGRSLTPAPR
jgi:hypothetical protein